MKAKGLFAWLLMPSIVGSMAACSDPTSTPASASTKVDAGAMMDACASAQKAVAAALTTPDLGVVSSSLDTGQKACSAAAAAFRTDPIPGLDSARAAEAADHMAAGLGMIKEAVPMLHANRRVARRRAQAGMREYKRGVDELIAVTAKR